MDIIEATETEITEKVGGMNVRFPLLSVYDRAALCKEDRKELRASLVANLKDSGIPGEQMFVELQQFDARRLDENYWIEFVSDIRSDEPIYRKSLAKAYAPDEVEKFVGLVSPSLTRKARICNLTINRGDGAPSDPSKPLTPEVPAVYGK